MTHDEFMRDLERITIEVEKYTDGEAPTIIGKTAADFFAENFQKEGFVDNGLQKWEEVRRRTDPNVTGADATRPILTGRTGNLGRSIDYDPHPKQVTVFSDVVYAEVHNKGLTISTVAGVKEHTRRQKGKTVTVKAHSRKINLTFKKRQFMGHSAELDKLIISEIERKLKSIKNENNI